MPLIKTTDEFKSFARSAEKADFITIDTEFISEKRFWPQLCLLQLATAEKAIAIDPLSPGFDLQALKPLLCQSPIPKIFHAGRQDMAIFYKIFGELPHPVVDTQIAAMVCGFGENVSYQRLVEHFCQASIEKSARFTDWSRRPLTADQLNYALSDVIYLRKIYEGLMAELEKRGRTSWIQEEMAWLTDPATYDLHPEEAWKRIRVRHPKPRLLNMLKELAAWREIKAQEEDLPRQRIIKDDLLLDIAQQAPSSREEMAHLRSIPRNFEKSSVAVEMLAVIEKARQTPKEKWPAVEGERKSAIDTSAAVDLLKVLLKYASEKEHVASKLIASAEDLRDFAAGVREGIHFLTGWRHEIFGAAAEQLLAGQLSLSLSPKGVILKPS